MTRLERVRLGLVVGCVALLAGLIGLYSYGRYKAGKAWIDKIKKQSGASLVRETDGFTYSQTMQGRTVFTLHASKAFQHTDGHYVLHDVVITLYGAKQDRKDRIYGSQFEWDEKTGIAKAVGEVQMDLQVPSGVAPNTRYGSPATAVADNIHVRTSGLTLIRTLGVAATPEQIEFSYKGLTCTAKGAEFNNNPNSLHLLADVVVHGELRGQPVALRATSADFDRSTNVGLFRSPVVVSGDQKAQAAQAVLHLRVDGSVERAEGTGGVAFDDGTRHVTGDRVDVTMNAHNQPLTGVVSGGVKLVDADAMRPVQGEAGEVHARFDGAGHVQEVTALKAAHVLERQKSDSGEWLEREVRSEQIVGTLATVGKKAQLKQAHLVGGASLRGETVEKGRKKSTSVKGDDLLLNFVPEAETVRVDKLHGQGHTKLLQVAQDGERYVSDGDTLDVLFAPEGKKGAAVQSAIQVGHVAVNNSVPPKPGSKKGSETSSAHAEQAAFSGDKLTLERAVHVEDGQTSLAADAVSVDQKSGDAVATGNVSATLAAQAGAKQQDATHVTAEKAVLRKAQQTAEFTSVTKPARMWQAASQVEARSIVMDRAHQTLVASSPGGDGVRSVFAAAAKEGSKQGPSVLRVQSRELVYSDTAHSAIFAGPVTLDGALGRVTGAKTTVFFVPRGKGVVPDANVAMGGQLDHVTVSGEVKLDQPGRHGTGEQLVYKAADGSFTLTGGPPKIVDAQQGTVTGSSLLFRPGDSTIVVSGVAEGENKPQRAHIETRVRQKPE